jgi:hypothetical protein
VSNENYNEFSKHFSAAEIAKYTTYLALSADDVHDLCHVKRVAVKPIDDKHALAVRLVVAASPAKWERIAYPPADARESSTRPPVGESSRAGASMRSGLGGADPDKAALAKLVNDLQKDGYSLADAIEIAKLTLEIDVGTAADGDDAAPAATYLPKTTADRWKGVVDGKSVAGRVKTDQHTHFYIFRVMTSMWSKHHHSARLETAYQSYLRGGASTFDWTAPKPYSDSETDCMKVHFERIDADALEKGYQQFDCTKNDGYESAPLVRGAPQDGMIMGFYVESS